MPNLRNVRGIAKTGIATGTDHPLHMAQSPWMKKPNSEDPIKANLGKPRDAKPWI